MNGSTRSAGVPRRLMWQRPALPLHDQTAAARDAAGNSRRRTPALLHTAC
jgi:hypothetical protein